MPAYLSREVLHEMITRFEEFLYDEILAMMVSKQRTRPPSRQSISNLSTGSQKDEPPVSTSNEDNISMSSFPATFYDADKLYHLLDEVLDDELDNSSE